MKQIPKVSIIIPNYDHALFIGSRLETVFNQTFRDFEVILLDDASTDHSPDILQAYSSHSKVSHFKVNKKNSGSPFQQWKRGIELAKGEYIWIAESDDFCDLNFLQEAFDFLNSISEKLGLVYTQSVDVDEKGNIISDRINWTENFHENRWVDNFSLPGFKFISKYLKVKNVIPNASAVIFRRDLVESNVFNEIENMQMCGDWLFWIRIIKNTDIGFLADSLNYFRHHRSVSRNHENLQKRKERIIEEAIVRRELRSHSIYQKEEIEKLYIAWVQLFQKKEVINSEFRRVLVSKSDFISLLAISLKMRF